MDINLLSRLCEITEEERNILDGRINVQKNLYTDKKDFVIDSKRLLEKGKLIDIRLHTRFIHFPKHRHNYVEMVYMCSGKTSHIINDTEKIDLKEGDLLILNQNVTQEIMPAGKEDIAVNFIILPEFFDRAFSMMESENALRDFLISTLSNDTSQTKYLHFQTNNILPVKNLIENIIWTLIEKKSGINTINQTTMGLIFMNLSAFADNVNAMHPNQYEQTTVFSALKYIEFHYKDGSLAELASALHTKPYILSRMLKKHTGLNFKLLLQQRRLQQAAYWLSRTSLSTDAIISSIGYHNSSYFYRKFKEKYHCSPKEYRRINTKMIIEKL